VGQVLVFMIVACLATGLVHYYLWRRLVRDTARSRRVRRAGGYAVLVLAVLVFVALVGGRVLPHRLAVAVAWPGYLWIAIMFYLLVTLTVLELPRLAVRLAWRRRTPAATAETATTAATAATAATAVPDEGTGEAPASGPEGHELVGRVPVPVENRRLFLARGLAVTAALATAGIVTSGVRSAMGPPRLKFIEIPLSKLPASADGLRIALVADIHLGPLRGYSHTRRIVDMINGLDADVVAIVGDLVDGSVAELGAAAAPLAELRARHGSYFVTGNHEYYSGFRQWVDEVASLGVRPLRNQRVEVAGGLDLAGVNDITGGAYGDAADVGAALAGHDPARPVVLLAHQPIQAHEAARHGVDLQLSGHTHGGQMVPFNLAVRLARQPIVSGLGTVDGMPVYVTNGAGFWGPPVRVGAPPDITLVRLRTR
jgi:predicted MPP superfamily phosphohydrolase